MILIPSYKTKEPEKINNSNQDAAVYYAVGTWRILNYKDIHALIADEKYICMYYWAFNNPNAMVILHTSIKAIMERNPNDFILLTRGVIIPVYALSKFPVTYKATGKRTIYYVKLGESDKALTIEVSRRQTPQFRRWMRKLEITASKRILNLRDTEN